MANANFNQTPSNINSTFKEVQLSDLQTIGETYYGITFNEGDVLEFPSPEQAKYWTKLFKNAKNPTAFTNIAVNGKVIGVPIGSLRKAPCDDEFQAFIESNPVNKEIYVYDNDAERIKFLLGKTLIVQKLVQGKAPIFVYSPEEGKQVRLVNEQKELVTKQAHFYVFAWKS